MIGQYTSRSTWVKPGIIGGLFRARRCFIAACSAMVLTQILSSPVLADEGIAMKEKVTTLFRISPEQYRRTIEDIFGSSILVSGRFEPQIRQDGLLAVGAKRSSVTSSGFEQYDSLARDIAAQVVDEGHRKILIPCRPRIQTATDNACAEEFISRTGRLLYRRPLTEEEVKNYVNVAAAATTPANDFYTGIATSLATMLTSPYFLFRHDAWELDPRRPTQYRMNAFSKAARLSFLLWNSTPDDDLLIAAERGDLHTRAGLIRQVDRLLNSPRLERGVSAFFSDMLGFDDFDTLTKDGTLFPKFTPKAKSDAQEQTLRTVISHLLKRDGDYRDLFTTSKTFLTSSLAALYGVPFVQDPIEIENGLPERWIPYEYPPGDPRAGILTHASFVALHAHAGRSSPTLRGKALRENLLCQTVPAPPGDVDFSLVRGNDPRYKTARERLTAHSTSPACAGCHKIMDPIGLALENFDAAGGFRLTENGAPIDTSGDVSGVKFSDAKSLGKVIHDDPAATSCVAERVFAFGAGHKPPPDDEEWLDIKREFASEEYRLKSLIRGVVTSNLFYSRPPVPEKEEAKQRAAAETRG